MSLFRRSPRKRVLAIDIGGAVVRLGEHDHGTITIDLPVDIHRGDDRNKVYGKLKVEMPCEYWWE